MVGLVKLRPPKKPSEVTVGKPSDLDDLIGFLSDLRHEIEDGEIERDLLISLASSLAHGKDGVVFLVRGDRGIEASIGIKFERRPLARTYRLRVAWSLVAPSARRDTGHAVGLIRAAMRFADAVGRPIYLAAGRPPKMMEFADRERDPCRRCGAKFHDPEPSAQIRFYSRHLPTAGCIFAHFPESEAPSS